MTVHRPQPQVPQHAARPQPLEEADLVGAGTRDHKVGDHVPIAVEGAGIGAADRVPARAAIPIGRARRDKVQVAGQLVARAAGATAHPRQRTGEGRGVAGVGGHPVAVQVPADGVQLGQIGDLDQPVVVGVVVDAISRRRRPLVAKLGPGGRAVAIDIDLEDRIVGGGAEVPGTVTSAVPVQVHVPVRVKAGIAGGRLQVAGRLAGSAGTADLPARRRVPVAGRDRGRAGLLAHEAAHVIDSADGAYRIAGAEAAVAPQIADQPAMALGFAAG